MTNTKMTHLQYVGDVPAFEASELKAGDVRMYNFGSTALVVKVIEKSAKTLQIITYESGKYYMSDIRKSTLVVIAKRDQDVSEHQPQEVYNVSGKEKGMVDVSEYFPNEEKQLEVYHMELQERGMALSATKPQINEGSEYKVIVSVDRDTNQVGEFKKVVTGKELNFLLFMNEVLEIIEEIKSETEHNIDKVEEVEILNDQTTEATYKTGTGSKGNGIEIYFTDKPNEEIRNQLKANGYRWNRSNSSWWTIETPERLEFAKSICGQSTVTENEYNSEVISESTFVSYPEIEINDLESGAYNISQELQNREHDANWITRTHKRDCNKELIDLFTEYQNKVLDVLETTDNEYYIFKLKQSLQRFKKNYHSTYVKYLSQKASTPSWITTGRGGLNASRYNKMMDRMDKTMSDLVSLPKEMDQAIIKYRNRIKKEQKSA